MLQKMFTPFYLQRCERDTGAGSRGAIPDCGLSSVGHALLLQRPLLGTKHKRRYRLKSNVLVSRCWSESVS